MREIENTLQDFRCLLGRWRLSGEVSGSIHYRWAEAENFLIQDIDLEYAGRAICGTEFIGHIHKPGEVKSPQIQSRFYSFLDGLTLDYIYEMEGEILRIWYEDKSLNNFMQAEFSEDGRLFSGQWQWPGGGYVFRAERLEDE